jgi:hypothetical protein
VSTQIEWVTVHLFAGRRLPLPLDEYLRELEREGLPVDYRRAMVGVPPDWTPPKYPNPRGADW